MNYEIQQALSRKVDEWKFSSLQQDVQRLQNENKELTNKVNELQSKAQSHNSTIELFLQAVIDSELILDVDKLYQIKNYL